MIKNLQVESTRPKRKSTSTGKLVRKRKASTQVKSNWTGPGSDRPSPLEGTPVPAIAAVSCGELSTEAQPATATNTPTPPCQAPIEAHTFSERKKNTSPLANIIGKVRSCVAAVLKSHPGSRKRMRVCESVSLGDKRFLAIVRVDSEHFLLGGSSGSVSLLAKLDDPAAFSSLLRQKSVQAELTQ